MVWTVDNFYDVFKEMCNSHCHYIVVSKLVLDIRKNKQTNKNIWFFGTYLVFITYYCGKQESKTWESADSSCSIFSHEKGAQVEGSGESLCRCGCCLTVETALNKNSSSRFNYWEVESSEGIGEIRCKVLSIQSEWWKVSSTFFFPPQPHPQGGLIQHLKKTSTQVLRYGDLGKKASGLGYLQRAEQPEGPKSLMGTSFRGCSVLTMHQVWCAETH